MRQARRYGLGISFFFLLVAWGLSPVAPPSVPSVQAAWEGEEKPEFLHAYTLRQGEWQVGMFHPLSVGVTDEVQISTVPLFDVLTLINLGVEVKLVDLEAYALSLVATGAYTPLVNVGGAGGSLISTFPLGEQLLLSVSGGYSWVGGAGETPLGDAAWVDDQGITYALEFDFILNPHDIFGLAANHSVDVVHESTNPVTVGLFYAHCWESFRLLVGLAWRSHDGFVIKQADEEEGEEGMKSPVMPMFDIWWRW